MVAHEHAFTEFCFIYSTVDFILIGIYVVSEVGTVNQIVQ